jgi:hypothetical protein
MIHRRAESSTPRAGTSIASHGHRHGDFTPFLWTSPSIHTGTSRRWIVQTFLSIALTPRGDPIAIARR